MSKKMIIVADLIGDPYIENGRGPEGFDCWGLCMEVCRRAKIFLPDINIPADNDLIGKLIDEKKKSGFVGIKEPRPYCLALFRLIEDDNKIKWHVGVVLMSCRHFIHTTGKMGVNISDLEKQPWKLFLEGFYIYAPENSNS